MIFKLMNYYITANIQLIECFSMKFHVQQFNDFLISIYIHICICIHI